MRVGKPLALGILVWGFGTLDAHADPIRWQVSPWTSWSSWVASTGNPSGSTVPAEPASSPSNAAAPLAANAVTPIIYWNESPLTSSSTSSANESASAGNSTASSGSPSPPSNPAPISWPTPPSVGAVSSSSALAPGSGSTPAPTPAQTPTITWPTAAYAPPSPSAPAPATPTPVTPAPTPINPVSTYNPTPPVAAAAPVTSIPVLHFNQTASSIAAVATPPVSAPPSQIISASKPFDAFINLGSGPYPQASLITTGSAQPWYQSTGVASLMGGTPTAQQIQSFDSTVLSRIQQTFSQSGIPITLTSDPNAAALHTISLVSNTASSSLPTAIGMTQVGANGFSFIDQSVKSAQTLDQLEWIVAHNISHELMLALGVPENYDQTGMYVDARMANLSMMENPNATFSPAAALAINQAIQSQQNLASGSLGAQLVGSPMTTVPEPTTWAAWLLGGLTGYVFLRRRRT